MKARKARKSQRHAAMDQWEDLGMWNWGKGSRQWRIEVAGRL